MKKVYPNYRSTGVQSIEDKLDKKEKKILKDFLTYCGITGAEKKVRETRISLLQVRDVMEKPFDKIELNDVRNFLAVLNKGYQRDWTKYGIKVYFKKFLKFQYPDWSMRFNNLEDIKFGTPSTQDKYNDTTLLTEEDIESMINHCVGYRDKSFISLKTETAGRPEEIRNLRFNSFDKDFIQVTLFSSKKKESRTVPCKNSSIFIEKWFKSYCYPDVKKEDYLFPSPENRNEPITSNAEWHLIKRIAKKAGIKKNVFGYLMRHTKLNNAYTKLPIQVHRKFAGHSRDSSMTATYEHLNNKDMMDVVLEKLYNEELNPEKKHELEELKIKIEKQDKKIEEMNKVIKDISKAMGKFS